VIDLSYLQQNPDDPKFSPEARILRIYKDKIKNIRGSLLYGKDLRTINKSDIDMLESDLREVIRGVEQLRSTAYLHFLLYSVDEVQEKILNAIYSLYSASDVLELQNTVRGRELLYQKLKKCQQFLFEAMEQFII
jgi:hypothetical protein